MSSSPAQAQPQTEPLVCFCHGVTETEIRKAIAEGARTVPEIQAKTLASTGCGGCGCEVERILEEYNEEYKDERKATNPTQK